jgi:lysozyme
MKTSPEGLSQLVAREGMKLKAYRDTGGVWTIGVGHTPAKAGQVITQAQAMKLLAKDIAWAEAAVNAVVAKSKVPVTQNMFDAMVSLCFNIGAQGFAQSTVARKLMDGDKPGAADAFLMWNKVKGATSKGLMNRRRSERRQFLST